MRLMLIAGALIALLVPDVAVQDRPAGNLPPSRRVTDPARPDFGFSPWVGTDVTVVVAFGVDCKPCEAAVSFYKRLKTEFAMDRKLRRQVFLSQGGIFPVMRAIEKHADGFRPDRVVAYPEDDRFAVKTLPTLLVFDGQWRRRGRWEGQLSSAQEREVFSTVAQVIAEAGKKGRTR